MSQKSSTVSRKKNKASFFAGRKEGIKSALTFLIGFTMSCANMFGGISPFGVAVVMSAPNDYLVQVGLGAVLGCLLPGAFGQSMKYFIGVLAALGIKIFFGGKINIEKRSIAVPILSFLTMGIVSTVMLRASTPNSLDIVLAFSEAMMAGGISFFFANAFVLYEKGVTVFSEKQDRISIVLSLCILLIGMSGLEYKGFSFGRSIAVIAVMICAYKGGSAMGCIAGVLVGVTIGMYDTSLFPITAAYGLAGIVAGLFPNNDRVLPSVGFISVNALLTVLSINDSYTMSLLYEAMAGSVIFMMIPQGFIAGFGFATPFDSNMIVGESKDIAVSKLSFASSAMEEVSKAVEVVSEKLYDMDNMDISSVFVSTSQSVCKRCSLRSYCWETAYQTTINTFNDTVKYLRNNGKVVKEDFPIHFIQKCIHPSELIDQINNRYYRFSSKENARIRITEIRSIVAEQFYSISEYLEQLSMEFDVAQTYDRATAQKIRKYFEKFGIEPTNVICSLDRYMRMSIEITLPTSDIRSVNRRRIGLDLSELCDRIFDMPCVDHAGMITKISLCEKASYTLNFGSFQLSYEDNKFCGDSLEYFSDLKGLGHMILSDGMGSGPTAAVDSAMACSLTSRLVKAGFNFSSALKMVNSALLVKSVDESLATVDVVSVDLYTGNAQFMKAGAAPTFVRKNGKAFLVEGDSLPIGILKGIDLYTKTTNVGESDIIMMVSDGVTSGGVDWIQLELEAFDGDDMNELSERICEHARKRRIDGHDDDITAVACILKKGV